MLPIVPYRIFSNACREAMTFYQQCLGGELQLSSFAELPGAEHLPEATRPLIAHARLSSGALTLLAYDDPHTPVTVGNSCCFSLPCASPAEAERLFAALSPGGTILMPLARQPWGAFFGMLTDRFGTQWMVDHDYPKV